jgi:serine phosphatase RsbU (regulator of sigma subunit)
VQDAVVEQARGILIERYGLTPHRALQRLIRVAQESRRPLEEVATDVVAARSGGLPRDPGPGPRRGLGRTNPGGTDTSAPTSAGLSRLERIGRIGEWEYDVTSGDVTWSPGMYAVFHRDPGLGPTDIRAAGWLDQLPTGEELAIDQSFDINGEPRIIHVRADSERGPAGELTRIVGIAHDVTVLRSAEIEVAEIRRELGERLLVQERDHIAVEALQRAALPAEACSTHAGIDVAARYLPTGGGPVGGDWYDVIPMSDGVWLCIGDVAGHGVHAAAAMTQLRNSARALVHVEQSPAEVLRTMNDILAGIDDSLTATCTLGFLDPGKGIWRWASAGHPPAAVLGDDPHLLRIPRGLMLGVTPHTTYDVAEAPLTPGDALILTSDGLYERPGTPLDGGLADLLASASLADPRVARSLTADEICDRLAAAQSHPRRDDACILVARVVP